LSLVEKAASVLAEDFGPVEDLFNPGDPSTTGKSDQFPLDERVKTFSLLTIEAVLQSKDLRMHSENSTFTLACWWCLNQPDDKQ